MELYTVVSGADYELQSNKGICLKKVNYSLDEYETILETAKRYYYKYVVESESTDFNDKYSSYNSYYIQINHSNLIVKDNKFYGVIVYGLEEYQRECYVCTLDEPSYNDYDGSCYSYVEKTYTLYEYELPEVALDFVHKYFISLNIKSYKVTKDGEEFDLESNHHYRLTAHDVILENGQAVGLKFRGLEYRLDIDGGNIHNWQEEKVYGYTFNYYYTAKLEEWSNDNE